MAARAPGRNPDHISTSRAWAACLLLCAAVPMAGFAQSPNARIPEVPDAGRSLREIESTQPEFAPLPDQAPLDDSAARPAPAPSGDPDGGARLHVRAFRLQGNLHVDTDALQAQLADLNGSEQDLAGLRAPPTVSPATTTIRAICSRAPIFRRRKSATAWSTSPYRKACTTRSSSTTGRA